MHGGTNPGGPIKHGLYSKRLGPLREAFEAHLANAKILDVVPQIAALDTIIEELLARALDGEGPGFRQEAYGVWQEFEAAGAAGDAAAVQRLGARLRTLLRDGWSRDRALTNAVGVLEKRAARAQRQQAITIKGEQVLVTQAVVAAFARIATIIRDGAPPRIASDLIRQISGALLVSGARTVDSEAGSPDVA